MRIKSLVHQNGSAFISAVMAAGIFSILIGGFLAYLSNEYLLNFRSHAWNGALHLAEAGVDAGFAELNYQSYLGGNGFTSGRGWSTVSDCSGCYTKTVTGFTDTTGQALGNFTITISGVGSINPLIQAVATATTVPRGPTIKRAIRCQLMASSRFPVAMMSKEQMDMNGNRIYTDSYDSTDTAKSTNKLYDPAKKQAHGNVASNGTIINTLNIGNADIYGVAYTGPGGTVALGPGGSIGPDFTTRDTTVEAALADGNIQSDFNVDVPDVVLPNGASTWSGAPGATGSGVGSIIKDATIGTGNYRVQDLTLNSSAHGDTLTITGNVNLYVQGNVTVGGLGQIVISSNASLTIYVAGSVSLAGNGLINNSQQPIKNQWYGLNSSTSWDVVGNGQWIGTVYAPNAAFSLKGGGTAGDMSGAVVARTITLTGQVQFHYDESLRQSNTGAGYAVASWQELRFISGVWVP